MARSIDEIKNGMTESWMREEAVARIYGFAPGDRFSSRFSRVSVENMLFYVVACAVWALEKLFDTYRLEIENHLAAMKPHTPRWYRDRALLFMKDMELAGDTGEYDLADMDRDRIAGARVVKYAAATESVDASILTVKVAGENGLERCPLDEESFRQFGVYMSEIKDAGVRLNLVNLPPDILSVEADVYYDPLLRPEAVREECLALMTDYIANLPFNGEFTNMSLSDAVREASGVRIVSLRNVRCRADGENAETVVEVRTRPVSGYFRAGEICINMIAYR